MTEPHTGHTKESIRAAHIRVPDHTVHRSFVTETVVLNLQTGKYHGLNPTGGRMLDKLQEHGTVAVAAEELTEEFGVPLETIEADLTELCLDLAERGLIEIDSA